MGGSGHLRGGGGGWGLSSAATASGSLLEGLTKVPGEAWMACSCLMAAGIVQGSASSGTRDDFPQVYCSQGTSRSRRFDCADLSFTRLGAGGGGGSLLSPDHRGGCVL